MLSLNLGWVPHFEKKIRSVLSYFAYCISWKISFRQVTMLKTKQKLRSKVTDNCVSKCPEYPGFSYVGIFFSCHLCVFVYVYLYYMNVCTL